MENPLVSVIIPTYNREQTILRSINSVLNQTYSNLECIVVDDASTDHTSSLIERLNDKRVIYLKLEMKKNASAARNAGLCIAKGDLIAFQDSDDEWLSQKLEKQVGLMESLPLCYGLIYCWMNYYDGDRLVYSLQERNRGNLYPEILSRIMTGGTPTLLIRKEIVSYVGGFDERITNGDDQDFIRRIARNYKIDFVPEVLVNVYINHNSHQRLSDPSIKENILAIINSYKITLEKFKDDLRYRPDLRASIYNAMAVQYSLLGDFKNFRHYNGLAWFYWPFRGRIKSTIRGLKTIRNLYK